MSDTNIATIITNAAIIILFMLMRILGERSSLSFSLRLLMAEFIEMCVVLLATEPNLA
jgi:hypothetical protein